MLIADQILVEGPADLLEHIAIRQEPELFDYKTTTTNAGLRQEISIKEGEGGAEIRAQLDAWSLCALRELVVLQRPGEVPVRVLAAGNAAWIPVSAGLAERRAERLEFQGTRAPR